MGSKLFLVDGSAYIFRAYFALPPLSRADGLPTHALYGFTSTLLKLMREEPAGLVVAFEGGGPTLRHERYPDYKANRPPVPEDLAVQYPLCMDAVRALGIPALAVPGYEADDVIATLCERARSWDLDPVIVSSDKDLMQLVGDGVTMYDPIKGRHLGPEDVHKRLGVGPERVMDLLALAGDSSDNIPGAPGIGPKTAAKLLDKFGDLDTLLARADEVGGKRGASLRANMEQVRLSRELVRLYRDVPLPVDRAQVTLNTPDPATARAFMLRYGFGALARLWPSDGAEAAASSGHPESAVATVEDALTGARYDCVRSLQELQTALEQARQAGVLSVDTETTSKDPAQAELVGISLAWASGQAAYLPLDHRGPDAGPQVPLDQALAALRPALEDRDFAKVGQNHKYDHQVLARYGVDLQGVTGDPMLASYLLNPDARAHGLDALAQQHLGHRMISYAEATDGVDGDFRNVPVQRACRYAGEDALACLELATLLAQPLRDAQLHELYTEVELPLSRVLAKMEARGVSLDAPLLNTMGADFGARLQELESACHELAGRPFLVSSPKQLAAVLFDDLGLPVIRRTKTSRSTAHAVLEELSQHHPLPARVLEYRQVAKLKSTYLDTLPRMVNARTGRVHTSFKQIGAATGRLSSADPNLQNIPVRTAEGRRIREAFVAAPGHVLLSADYSQIELRLRAHLAEEPGLTQAFCDGADIHARTAAELFGLLPVMVQPEQRRAAKAINFGILYGMSAFRLAREQGISQREARRFIDAYFDRYPRIRTWIDANSAAARQRGHTLTVLGRRRALPGLRDRNRNRQAAAERVATNTPIQGSAADVIKLAMLRLQRLEDAGELQARMLLQVHDELLFEVPVDALDQAREQARAEMEAAMELRVPLVVAVGAGRTWAEAH